jgi:dinuclear metal center YbgI/SA1388 family protein
MKIENLLEKLKKFSDLSLQEAWDNSGIQILLDNSEISKVLLSLDITSDVIDYAIREKTNLIISHHPFIFSGIKSINYKKNLGNNLIKAIRNNINIFSFHTNIDKSVNGLADFFCKKLGLTNIKPLTSKVVDNLYKVITFVPENYIDKFLETFTEKDISVIGKYKACSFYSKGTGTFFPLDNAEPFCGEKGILNKVVELKIEIQTSSSNLNRVVQCIKEIHPYEEPLIDIYNLGQKGSLKGSLGRIGYLQENITFLDLISRLKSTFNLHTIKVSGLNKDKKISKIAVCPGSGMSLIESVIKAGVDVYITGDVKYHEALNADEVNLPIIDVGHFGSEFIFTELLNDFLKKECGISAVIYEQKDVFKYL